MSVTGSLGMGNPLDDDRPEALRREWIDYDLAVQIALLFKNKYNEDAVSSKAFGRYCATLAYGLVAQVQQLIEGGEYSPQEGALTIHEVMEFMCSLHNKGWNVTPPTRQ